MARTFLGGTRLAELERMMMTPPGDLGHETSAVLELPASWAEYHDALEKAWITDDRTIYSATRDGDVLMADNFFEREFRKLFEDNPIMEDILFDGRACIGRLTDTSNVKLRFVAPLYLLPESTFATGGIIFLRIRYPA